MAVADRDTLTFKVDGRRHALDLPADAELDLTHPAVLRAAGQVSAARRARENAAKAEAAAEKVANRPKRPRIQPDRKRYRSITTGTYKRRMRPQASPDDRRYVPGALKHWRIVHGLSTRDAQARIGYSATSASWSHYESGFVCPPYLTLLRIIGATGMGYHVDRDNRAGIDPALRLDVDRAQWAAAQRARRAKRQPKKPAS